jgi:GntR family transcriptional regulator/MocR family aminotransferase
MSELSISDYLMTHLDRQATQPMNRQLYRLLRDGILSGAVACGLRLPPSRSLAGDLGISRNTVTYAYDQLTAEGYLEARVGAGTYVADTEPDMAQLAPSRTTGDGNALSSRGRGLLAGAGAGHAQWGGFMPGLPDITCFPHDVWNKIQQRHWRRADPRLLTYGDGAGLPALRDAIASHLRTARSVNCTADQVIITSGTHQSIQLVAMLLGEAGDRAWIEDPCYWGTRNVIRSGGLEPVPVPVDGEGMRLDDVALRTPPRFIFVTPSHQYPLGPVMSLARRRLLLEYAALHNAWIVEDDYDSEFRYGGPPLASLQGLDQHARTIYLGTFSKTLFPGLRIGFMVVPAALAASFSRANAEMYRDGQGFLHAVLADFLREGHFSSHVRRMRQLYAARLRALEVAIRMHLGSGTPIWGSAAGLHLVLGLPDDADDARICAAAGAAGILTRPLSAYYADPGAPGTRRGLMLGYAAVPEERIDPLFSRLAQVIRDDRPARGAGPAAAAG